MNRPEQAIHRAVFAHLRARPMPGVIAFHVPNGGARSKVEASIFKSLGVLAGLPDLICIKKGQTYCLELKARRGRLSAAQHITINALLDAGAEVAVAYDLDEALERLEAWGLLRGRAV